VVYLVVGVAVLLAAGPGRLARSAAPLAEAVRAAGVAQLVPVVAVGGILASLGALLALIAGIGRTTLAMARHRDLPGWLAAVHPRYHVPHHAEIALGVVVCVLAATVDLRRVIGFSSFGVLTYYAIANASAYTQPTAQRRWPRALNVCGVVGCLLLIATLPWQSVVVGLGVFVIGLTGRAFARRFFTDPQRE
jgi:basic amino acid/polyamine antiporter, APA family